MNAEDLFDEPTVEARLRGASTRLVALLDPPAPDALATDAAVVADATKPAPTRTSIVVPPPAKAGRWDARRWLPIGAAAGVALLVGSAIAVNGGMSRDRDDVAAVSLPPVSDTTAGDTSKSTPAEQCPTCSIGRPSREFDGPAETAAPTPRFDTDGRSASPSDLATRKQPSSAGSGGLLGEYPGPGESDERVFPTPTLPFGGGEPVPGAVPTLADAQSTFALDVDTGSYTRLRERLRSGLPVDPAEVRTEELLNFFRQDYAGPQDQTFAVRVDGTTAPFLPDDTRIVRIGVQAKELVAAQRKDISLTFVIDVSGSMEEGGKLELVKQSLLTLVDGLKPNDRVAIVAFSDEARVVLEATEAGERGTIARAIATLQPTNSTNAEAGLRLGYQLARSNFSEGRLNRVVLASDGVANVGPTGPEAISAVIREQAGKGIQLVTVGVGKGAYNDTMMEQLADNGDGFYTYIDGPEQAFKVFSEQLTGTLQAVAIDAKAQVTFDSNKVAAYRLLGYENRAVADSDFRNDRVDGGEIGAGHASTALYVVQLVPGARGDIGRAQVRWTDPTSKRALETGADIALDSFSSDLTRARPRLQQDVYIAAWAEILRGGPWAGRVDLQTLAARAQRLAALIPGDSDVADLIELIGRSAGFAGASAYPYPPTTYPTVTTLPW